MNECILIEALLIEHLEKKQKDTDSHMPTSLMEHIKKCNACLSIIEDEILAKAYLHFKHQKDSQKQREKNVTTCNQLEQGQIWRFLYGAENLPEFAVVSTKQFKAADNLESAIRIIPIFLNPIEKEVCSTDIKMKSTETILGVPLLLEYWNERPIHTSLLRQFMGKLSKKQWEKLDSYLKNPPDETTNLAVSAFRNHEISRGSLFSESVFEELTSKELELTDSPPISNESAIKMIIRFGKNIIEKTTHLTNGFIADRTESYASIGASGGNDGNADMNKLYNLLYHFVKSKNTGFQIRYVNEKPIRIKNSAVQYFSLKITYKNGRNVEFKTKNGTINITARDLQKIALKEISIIELEQNDK